MEDVELRGLLLRRYRDGAASRSSGRDDKGQLRFASSIVIGLLVFLALFTVAMTIIYCYTGGVPGELCIGVYGTASAEFMSLAAKRIFEGKKKTDDEY